MELFAIVRSGSGEVLWADVTTPELANDMAVMHAVAGGSMNLLSGADLGRHLLKGAGVMWREV